VALAFTTGTINQPDAGSVGLAMVEQLRDDLIVHAAWDLVEEFTPASGLVRWYVFKCLASQSGLPSDYFVVIGRTLGDGSLRFFICESYTLATHTVAKFCSASATTGAIVYDSLGRIPDATTYILSTTVPNGSAQGTPYFNSWAPSGSSTKYWIIVADDGFAVAFSGASNGFFHCGTYTPIMTLPIAMPVHCYGSAAPSSAQGHMLRNPAVAGISHFGCALMNMLSLTSVNGPVLGFEGDLKLNDALQGGQRLVAEQGITLYQAFGASDSRGYPTMGWAVGKVKRMRVNTTVPPVGFSFGDGYVLQSRLWVPYNAADGRMWDTGVSA